VQCEGGDVLAGLRAGRVAVSAARAGPLLLRVGTNLVALAAEGLILTNPFGHRRPVTTEPATFPATPGPHWLEDHHTTVHALAR
jgi:hypothetical protein